jgi:hypothetical protein
MTPAMVRHGKSVAGLGSFTDWWIGAATVAAEGSAGVNEAVVD